MWSSGTQVGRKKQVLLSPTSSECVLLQDQVVRCEGNLCGRDDADTEGDGAAGLRCETHHSEGGACYYVWWGPAFTWESTSFPEGQNRVK